MVIMFCHCRILLGIKQKGKNNLTRWKMNRCERCVFLKEGNICNWTNLNVYEDETEYDIDIDCQLFEDKSKEE